MFEELRIFLVDNTTKEEIDLVERAFVVFDDLYPPNIRDKFELILFTQDESLSYTGHTLDEVIKLVSFYLTQILTEHSIFVNDEISLNRLVTIIEALMDIQHFEDIDTINNILNLDISKEEKLAEILALVCDLDTADILIDIEEVSDSLLDRLKEHSNESTNDTSLEVETDISSYVTTIKDYIKFLQTDDLTVVCLIKDGLKPGYEFQTYASMIGRDFESLDPKRAARELMAMALISVDGNKNPKSIVSSHIDKLISDFRLITKVDIELTNLLLEYQIYLDHKK